MPAALLKTKRPSVEIQDVERGRVLDPDDDQLDQSAEEKARPAGVARARRGHSGMSILAQKGSASGRRRTSCISLAGIHHVGRGDDHRGDADQGVDRAERARPETTSEAGVMPVLLPPEAGAAQDWPITSRVGSGGRGAGAPPAGVSRDSAVSAASPSAAASQ